MPKNSSTPRKTVEVMPYFRTEDGCRLYYEIIGTEAAKPVIVFLNGTLQNTVHWTGQVRHFQKRYRIILYDGRSQGRSDIGDRPLGIDVHAADLSALLEFSNVAKANLVGISHGARVALETAVRHPHRASRLVLCSTTAIANTRTHAMLKYWKDILATSGLEAAAWAMLPSVLGETYLAGNRKMLPKMVKAITSRNRPDSLLAHLDAMLAYPPPSLMPVKSGWPVLVISGAQDPLLPAEAVRKFADQVGGRHVLFNDVGHTIQIEAPDRFNCELEAFLGSNDH